MRIRWQRKICNQFKPQMLNNYIQVCKSLTYSMSLEHMTFLKWLITLKVRKQKSRKWYRRCIAMSYISTRNCDNWFLILLNSEGKLCCKAYIHSAVKGTISLLSQQLKLNYMSPPAGDIYRSWFRVCPSVRPYVRPSVRNASLFRAISQKILNVEFSNFFPKLHTN